MPTIATQKNYRMACSLSQINNAVQVLMDADVTVHDIATINGRPTMITDPIPATVNVAPLSTVRKSTETTVRVVLCGCLIEYTKFNEVAA